MTDFSALRPENISTHEQALEFLTAYNNYEDVQEACGNIGRAAVLLWRQNGIPYKHIKKLQVRFGISRELLRPDIYL